MIIFLSVSITKDVVRKQSSQTEARGLQSVQRLRNCRRLDTSEDIEKRDSY